VVDFFCFFFFFSSRRRHTSFSRDWSSDVCSSDLFGAVGMVGAYLAGRMAAWIPGPILLLGFGLVALASGLAMMRERKESSPRERSEERRVGKECRFGWSGCDLQKNTSSMFN